MPRPHPDLKTAALRAIARANPERWPDENLRTLINEMQHAAKIALEECDVAGSTSVASPSDAGWYECWKGSD